MSILQKIFSDHFHKLSNSGINIRDTVIENVDKMIRYYGIYAKHHRHEGNLSLFIPKEKRRFHTRQNFWRTSISSSFHAHSCTSVGMKWLFFNFTLKALRFLKITRIWLILLNAFSFHHKQKTQPIQLTDNQKFNNFLWGLHNLFLLCHFWLIFYFTIIF